MYELLRRICQVLQKTLTKIFLLTGKLKSLERSYPEI